MITYREEKINNAICYFASEHLKRTNRNIRQTLLYKYLAFLDFDSIRERGKPVLELRFSAYNKGPIPPEISTKRENYNTDCFSFINTGGNYYKIISKKEADLKYFSRYEIDSMNKILNKYSKKELSNKEMIDKAIYDSHRIRAWVIARGRISSKKMHYEDMFPNINKKFEKDLTPEEENFLVYDGLNRKAYECRRRIYME